VKNNK